MREDRFTCDVCGKTRGEGNHWLMRKPEPSLESVVIPASPAFTTWMSLYENDPTWGHLCSRECALKLIERWLEKNHGKRPQLGVEGRETGLNAIDR